MDDIVISARGAWHECFMVASKAAVSASCSVKNKHGTDRVLVAPPHSFTDCKKWVRGWYVRVPPVQWSCTLGRGTTRMPTTFS